MNVLLINGSPKGSNSNSYQLAVAFLSGLKQQTEDIQTRELSTSRMEIKPCLGCFSCWNRTPGQCCIRDDMNEVIQSLLWADITIWSFPLYYFSVPGPLKNLIDRQLPMVLPFMEEQPGQVGNGNHPSRYDMSGKRTVVISTCGFYTAEGNYDGVVSLFDHLCGPGNYTSVFCGQGELFRVPELSARTGEYLSHVTRAGREFLRGGISRETRQQLEQLLLPRETFEACADASWGLDRNGFPSGEKNEKESDTLIFTRQMAALYRKDSYPGRDIVLEMRYTDVEESYQILLGKDGSKVCPDGTLPFTTKIETPVTVWRAIASGQIRGDEAIIQGLYRVTGDFNLMLKWDNYFSGSHPQPKPSSPAPSPQKTNMNQMLLPWIVLWIVPAIQKMWGCLFSITVCALVPLLFYRNRKTLYDIFSNVFVTILCVIMLAGASEKWMLPFSYLSFGVMWLTSCPGKRIPLTAHYSMNSYGGEDALNNVLFLKTNRILTMLWGLLYLFTSVFTFFLMQTVFSPFVGLINSVLPLLMGIFTAWFQKWYPARVAAGK